MTKESASSGALPLGAENFGRPRSVGEEQFQRSRSVVVAKHRRRRGSQFQAVAIALNKGAAADVALNHPSDSSSA